MNFEAGGPERACELVVSARYVPAAMDDVGIRIPLVWMSCLGRLGLGLLTGYNKIFSKLPSIKI